MLIECPNCNTYSDSKSIGSYIKSDYDDPIYDLKFSLIECIKCNNPILVEESTFFDNDFQKFYFTNPKILYPNSDFHLNPIIPKKLRDSLNESIKCFNSNSYTATTIMCRRTIEGFCKIKGIKEKNLAKSIEKLKLNGDINQQLFEWANELRLVGNEAAHNIDMEFSKIDSKDILDFTIAILDFTYSFKEKFDKFKQRQGRS